jgi:nicotinate-nucleotide adenylyltransferase
LQLMKEKEFNNSAMLIVSDFELKLPQPTQTIRTVEALTQKFPDYKFWFVYGGDSYQSLPSWESGDYLRDSLPVLLVNRYGFDLPKESEHIRYIALNSDKNLADVSSTLVRQSLQTGSSYSTLINDSTRAFIRDRMLYWASKKA